MKHSINFLLAVFILFTAIFSVIAAVSASVFTDVKENDFYYDSVDFLKNEGIVSGYSDGSYGYGLNINRAELLKIIVEAKFFDTGTDFMNMYGGTSCFKDVPASQWYTKYICYAKHSNWVEGYRDGTFRPAQNISFVEALKIVLEIFEVEYPKSEDVWYKGVVETASQQNIIPLTISEFGQTINRAEMADMIARKIKQDEGKLEEFLGSEQAEVVVTYESISNNIDQSAPFIEAVEENGAVCGDDFLESVCKFEYNVIAGVYTTFKCNGKVKYDFEVNPDFQAFFSTGTFISGDTGILYGKKIYFSTYQKTTYQARDSKVVSNSLIEFDASTNKGRIIYQKDDANSRKMMLHALDLAKSVLVVSYRAVDSGASVCFAPWISGELYSVSVDGVTETPASYVVPACKVTEEQAKAECGQ